MTEPEIASLAALFRETGEAHHRYETDELNGELDADWADWYADYMLANGLDRVLAAPVSRDRLSELLVEMDCKYKAAEPDQHWGEYYAQLLVEHLARK